MELFFTALVTIALLLGAEQLSQYMKKLNLSPEKTFIFVLLGGITATVIIILAVFVYQFFWGSVPGFYSLLGGFGLGLLLSFSLALKSIS